jgi:glucose-1-phosphate thymidylyltransferase
LIFSQDSLIVIGGDTLFYSDFSLLDCQKRFYELGGLQTIVLCYRDENTTRTGILEVDDTGKVTNFLEKPQPHETLSRLACPCFYILCKDALNFLKKYVSNAKTLKDVDATGQFIAALFKQVPVMTYSISGRFDIGALDSYIQANDYFS